MLQTIFQALVHKAVEKVDLVGARLQYLPDDRLDHGLSHIHVAVQVAEGHLRLDHPKLGGVALGVGLFSPEGGAEGVHVPEGHGEVLGVELAGDGQAGGLAEEVLGEVHFAVGGEGRVLGVQSGHPEHLAGTLAVGGGDDGGVDVHEALALEEVVDGVGGGGAHPEGGGEEVGAGAQVLDGAQKLHRVALLLEGVVGGGGALHSDGVRLELQGLLGLGSEDHGAGDHQGGPHVLPGDLLEVIQARGLHHHLEVFQAGAVVELDKAEGLHVADGAGPAADGDCFPAECLLIGKHAGDLCAFHWVLPLYVVCFSSAGFQKDTHIIRTLAEIYKVFVGKRADSLAEGIGSAGRAEPLGCDVIAGLQVRGSSGCS